MVDSELPVSIAGSAALVPSGYAEKAMASLMQLHTELMEEKERRVDLYRRLMEKEQTLAELRAYVKILEDRLEGPRESRAPASDAAEVLPRPVRAVPPPPPPPTLATKLKDRTPGSVVRLSSRAPGVPKDSAPIVRLAPQSSSASKEAPKAVASTAVGADRRSVPTDGWKTW